VAAGTVLEAGQIHGAHHRVLADHDDHAPVALILGGAEGCEQT
jgi:hypothetical protein